MKDVAEVRVITEARRLVRKWGSQIAPVVEFYEKKKGVQLGDNVIATMAWALENTVSDVEKLKRLAESTYSSDAGQFVKYGFSMIAALLPSLISNDLVSMQPMDKPTGEVYFLDILADGGANSRNVSDQETIMGAEGQQYTTKSFTVETVDSEVVATANGSAVTLSGTLDLLPVRKGVKADGTGFCTFWLSNATTVLFKDDGVNGTITGTGVVTGSVNYTNGTVSITFSAPPTNAVTLKAKYDVNTEVKPTAINKAKLSLRSRQITARRSVISADWLLDAAYDLEKAHGRDIDVELITAMTGFIKAELDQIVVADLFAGATDASISFNCSMSGLTGVTRREHFSDIVVDVLEASNKVLNDTGRGTANFLVCGTNAGVVLGSAAGFEGEKNVSKGYGPRKMGTMNGLWNVFLAPNLGANDWFVGFKGESFLDAGYVFAPYQPITVTPPLVQSNFTVERGILSRNGRGMVNSKLYVKGAITGF